MFLNAARCRAAFPQTAGFSHAALARHPALVDEVRRRLDLCNAGQGGSSHRVARVLLLLDTPSPEDFEVTDKGYLNQRAVLERRAVDLQRLYGDAADPDIAVSDSGLD